MERQIKKSNCMCLENKKATKYIELYEEENIMIKNEVYEKAFQRAVVKRTFFGGSIVPLINIGVRHISGFEFEGEFTR